MAALGMIGTRVLIDKSSTPSNTAIIRSFLTSRGSASSGPKPVDQTHISARTPLTHGFQAECVPPGAHRSHALHVLLRHAAQEESRQV